MIDNDNVTKKLMEKERKDLEDSLVVIGGKFALFMNIANLIFQIQTFVNPTSTRHLIVNTIYSLNTMISCSLLWVGYRHKRLELIFPAFALCGLRNTMRMIDIEDSVPHMSTLHWANLLV